SRVSSVSYPASVKPQKHKMKGALTHHASGRGGNRKLARRLVEDTAASQYLAYLASADRQRTCIRCARPAPDGCPRRCSRWCLARRRSCQAFRQSRRGATRSSCLPRARRSRSGTPPSRRTSNSRISTGIGMSAERQRYRRRSLRGTHVLVYAARVRHGLDAREVLGATAGEFEHPRLVVLDLERRRSQGVGRSGGGEQESEERLHDKHCWRMRLRSRVEWVGGWMCSADALKAESRPSLSYILSLDAPS
ncbi:unnamed protein product, partial [Mycena citricolor]